MDSTTRERVVAIDLDDNTDTEVETIDEDESPKLIDTLDDCLSSDEDFDVELIEEIVFKDHELTQTSTIALDINDESQVKRIEDYLKDDSFESDVNKYTKKKKKSKARKKLIADLTQENHSLRERLYLKVREIQNLRNPRNRIVCFRCTEPAAQEFLCCLNGCYCSKKCREIDWILNQHFKDCLRHPFIHSTSDDRSDQFRPEPTGRFVKRMKW